MNVADSEVVAAIMQTTDYRLTDTVESADVILLNTCSIRDNAEQKIVSRLHELNSKRQKQGNCSVIIGVIGCMAERTGQELIGKYKVDFVAGPDAYLDIPSPTYLHKPNRDTVRLMCNSPPLKPIGIFCPQE